MSQNDFLLAGIDIQYQQVKEPEVYNYSSSYFKSSEHDFFLHLENVACFRVQNGEKVTVSPYDNVDEDTLSLFLEESVLGALLHQKGILTFHGSTFLYKNKGIMICGATHAGKSSITAAFCQCGALFITDDVSPVSIVDNKATILPVKTRIKLWEEALNELNISTGKLKRIRPSLKKFYLPDDKKVVLEQALNQIFILCTHTKNEYVTKELKGTEKFDALHSQIFHKKYLKGMPEVEKKYFVQLFSIANNIKVSQVFRPEICDIHETMCFIEKEIEV